MKNSIAIFHAMPIFILPQLIRGKIKKREARANASDRANCITMETIQEVETIQAQDSLLDIRINCELQLWFSSLAPIPLRSIWRTRAAVFTVGQLIQLCVWYWYHYHTHWIGSAVIPVAFVIFSILAASYTLYTIFSRSATRPALSPPALSAGHVTHNIW